MREGLNRNGLRTRTYFYPGALLPIRHEDLPPHAGFLGRSLAEFRAVLRVALGIGRGSCLGANARTGSCRGRVVALSAGLTRDIRAAFAIVLTEPAYSAQRKYQIILPVFTEFSRAADRYDLLVRTSDWFNAFLAPVGRVLLPIPITQSVWHHDGIARETEYVLDDESLREIDLRLCDYFSLPPLEAAG